MAQIAQVTLADDTLNQDEGLYYSGSAGDRIFITNTIVTSHTTGIHNQGATGTMEANYILYFNNTRNTVGSVTGNVGNVTGDPRFVDPIGNDFDIQAGSAAIDAGTDTGITPDIVGTPRPQGLAYDIGAYEYLEPSPPTATPTTTATAQAQGTATPTSTPTATVTSTLTVTATPGNSATATAQAQGTATPTSTSGTPSLYMPVLARDASAGW